MTDQDEAQPQDAAKRETLAMPSLQQAPSCSDLGSGSSGYRRVAIGRVAQQPATELSTSAGSQRRSLMLFLLVADLAALGLSLSLGQYWTAAGPIAGPIAALLLLACPLFALSVMGAYRWSSVAHVSHLPAIGATALGGALSGLVLHKLVLASEGSTGMAVVTLRSAAWVLAFAAWAMASRALARRFIRARESGWAVVALGDADDLVQIGETLKRARLDDRLETIDLADTNAAHRLDELIAERVHCIVLPVGRPAINVALRLALVHARLAGIRVLSLPDLIEELDERVPIAAVDTWWMLELELLPTAGAGPYLVIKRTIDLLIASTALLALLPVMAATALAVRLTSSGPALFTQTRDGLHRKPFTIYKFRTMRTDAEAGGARWASRDDPRVTPIGAFLRKSRLDELPQLWNVIRGDMTLVGPRPERPEFNSMLADSIPWYDLRHLAKPGLTGWAQVRYPYGASVADAIAKLEFDVYYLKHASPGFDLRVLLRTVSVVLGLRGR
jgi:exopolysaccharide biosynthesis polyprenyl glycosylphosphotransferase